MAKTQQEQDQQKQPPKQEHMPTPSVHSGGIHGSRHKRPAVEGPADLKK